MANHDGIKDGGAYLVIVPESRQVTVPSTHKVIGVVGDHLSEQITFQCPRIVDGHDISQCARRYISWKNVNGVPGHDMLSISQADEENVLLTWDVRDGLTVAKGVVHFSIHFEDDREDGDGLAYKWGTTTCKSCEILDSLNTALSAYTAVWVEGDTLVFADYATPLVQESTIIL